MSGSDGGIRDERSRAVLRAAVETYISSASPVASGTLRKHSLTMSSAAIRAVMATLETGGYLAKPHTSAGRIPTTRGYRTYVDELMPEHVVDETRRARVSQMVDPGSGRRRLMRACSRALADATGLTGFAVCAPRSKERHRHVEFVRLGRSEVVAIFATWGGTVYHQRVSLETDVSQSELDRFQNFLNGRFAGLSFDEMRAMVQDELSEAQTRYSTLAARAFALSDRALPAEAEAQLDVVVDGHHHLLAFPEFATAEHAGPVLEELERRRTWVALLDAVLSEAITETITVLIGAENNVSGLQECAVVAVAVPWDDSAQGTVGLVGPTRLAYGAVISLLDYVRHHVMTTWPRRRYSA